MTVDARQVFDAACEARGLTLPDNYFDVLVQVAETLRPKADQPKQVIGIGGSQGSGKSTFATLLAGVLTKAYDCETIVLSLDDFYLPKADRQTLSKTIPLLETRGVPGTHDLPGCLNAIENFQIGAEIQKPIFSKADDDRLGVSSVATERAQLLIFEGWCWGAVPQSDTVLSTPVNELEAKQDSDGAWRHYVNEQLATYQTLFNVDSTIYLKSPGMQAVRDWRLQQEQSLPKPKSQQEIDHFVQFFERITLAMMQESPGLADICISLDVHHKPRIEKRN